MSADRSNIEQVAMTSWNEEVTVSMVAMHETGCASSMAWTASDGDRRVEGEPAAEDGDNVGSTHGDEYSGDGEEGMVRKGYKIRVGGTTIAVISFVNPRSCLFSGSVIARMGECISGVVRFCASPSRLGQKADRLSDGVDERRYVCKSLAISLETEERVLSNMSEASDTVLSRRVHYDEEMQVHSSGYNEIGFLVPLPATGAIGTGPTFTTKICSLSWVVRFAFTVIVASSETRGHPEDGEEKLEWSLPLLVLPPR